MALKDLVADKAAQTEEAIEKVVADYVQYYENDGEIGFKPAYGKLKNDQKVLVYLTAILGWEFITDNPPSVRTKPADMGAALGISGGTLRPLLKTLREAHLLGKSEQGYSVRTGNLDEINAYVSGEKKARAVPKRAVRNSPRKNTKKKEQANKKQPNHLSTKIISWVETGYFDEWRSLNEVLSRLHEKGIIAKPTSVSGPLLRAVQNEMLIRKKQVVNGRDVWKYRRNGIGPVE